MSSVLGAMLETAQTGNSTHISFHPLQGATFEMGNELQNGASRGLFCLVCIVGPLSLAASAILGRQLVLEQLMKLPVISLLW